MGRSRCSPRPTRSWPRSARTDDERLTGVGAFVRHLADEGHLDPAAVPHATDAAWVLTSPTLYAQLVHARHWPPARYRHWLATMLSAALQ